MNSQDTPDTQPGQDKQVTVAIPEQSVAEFYAFFGRFLAGGRARGRYRAHAQGGPRRDPQYREHRCGGHQDLASEGSAAARPAGSTTAAEAGA